MKKELTLLFLISCISMSGFTVENPRAGAGPLALSGAFVAVPDPWSTFYNQAGLAGINSTTGAVFYSSRFGLKELSQMAGTFILPVRSGVFGFSFSQFGTGQFKEGKFGFAFAKILSQKFSAGIQADYFSSLLPENSRSKGTVTFEGGILYKPTKQLNLGIHFFNPVNAGIKTFSGKVKIATTLRVGGNYRFSEYLQTCFELERSPGAPIDFRTGTEFFACKNLALRFGVSLWPLAYTAGAGYSFGKITTDMGFSYHGNLGFTPSVSIGYKIK